MCSVPHLYDIVNEQVFLAFGGVFLMPLVWVLVKPKLDAISSFLILMISFFFIYSVIWNPDLGMPNDWDLFSPLGVPVMIWLAYVLLGTDGISGKNKT